MLLAVPLAAITATLTRYALRRYKESPLYSGDRPPRVVVAAGPAPMPEPETQMALAAPAPPSKRHGAVPHYERSALKRKPPRRRPRNEPARRLVAS